MKHYFTLPLVVLCLAAFAQPLYAEHDFAPDRRDMVRIRDLARDLERAADDLDRGHGRGRATPLGGHDDDDHDRRDHESKYEHSDRFFDAAERFAEDAEDFEDSVRRYMNQPERTIPDFRKLRGSYQSLLSTSRKARLDSRHERHFREVQVLVSEISRYYGGSSHPQIDWRRIQILAHEIEEQAAELYVEARRDLSRYAGHSNDSRIREAIWRFDELRNAARHFHRQVEEGRRDPGHIRSDFKRLLDAHDHANRYIWYLSYETRRDILNLTRLIDEIDARGFDGKYRRRHVDARPFGPVRPQSSPPTRTVDFEDAWPQLLISLLGGNAGL